MFLIGKYGFQYFGIKSTFPLIILVLEWPINSLIVNLRKFALEAIIPEISP